uniref:P43 5S RNA-binding protein n=1 Tax=Mastacembelus armatus TaxID=205130 RepID=A0A3Q3MZB6_9TELE
IIQDEESVGGPPRQVFSCAHADCKATFSRQWKLAEHETAHSGARPCQCAVNGCGRSYSRKSHLTRHMLIHEGVKQFKCEFVDCSKSFFESSQLKRHVRFAHGQKNEYFKCNQPDCSLTFKKRRLLKMHLKLHEVPVKFKCSKNGCTATFDSHVARKAHEKKHAGYRCHHATCQVFQYTWKKLQKHMANHSATYTCQVCKKVFKKADALRRHKRSHASHKPVLVCPKENCQAYFSTTFNLQHHIRKVHLQLLKYKCSFPNCPRAFAMRESLTRHLNWHSPNFTTQTTRQRPSKSWQKRLNKSSLPLVEDNLHRLFALRMRISRRPKVDTNLSGFFSEGRSSHFVSTEVNLRNLFNIEPPHASEEPEIAPLQR